MEKYVYLIKSESNSNYKIGISKNPKKRLAQLQTGNDSEIRLICSFKSEHFNLIEKALHSHYQYKRNSGEWFELTLEDEVDFIEKCKIFDNGFKYLKDNKI